MDCWFCSFRQTHTMCVDMHDTWEEAMKLVYGSRDMSYQEGRDFFRPGQEYHFEFDGLVKGVTPSDCRPGKFYVTIEDKAEDKLRERYPAPAIFLYPQLAKNFRATLIEPEYEAGQAYVDQKGVVFLRTTNGASPWVQAWKKHNPYGGQYSAYGEDFPSKPMRKLT